MRKPAFRFPTRSYTNWDVQPQKMARGLKFWTWEVEGLYYLCSENKGSDQLHSYYAAELHLCFHIYAKNRVFYDMAHKHASCYQFGSFISPSMGAYFA